MWRSSGKAGRFLATLLLLLAALQLASLDGLSAAQQPAPAAKIEFVPNQLLVGFDPEIPEVARVAAVEQRGGRILLELDSINAHLVEIPAGRKADSEAGAYAADAAVRFAEPNFIYRTSRVPNDPGFGNLWGLRNTGQPINGQPGGTPGADVGATAAWDVTTGSRDIVVGVVDTGVDYHHPDLAANMWRAPAGWSLNGCGAGTYGYRRDSGVASCDPRDDDAHGTHVAGTIGAVGDNGVGVTGVNWNVSIMALKFIGADGSGTLADAIAVIDYGVRAKQAGVNLRVLNNSWGGGGYSQALLDEITLANANGILFVAASGNGGGDGIGDNNDVAPAYPASYNAPNVISVTATDYQDGRASFANYGAVSVHLGAPGVDIYSTIPTARGSYAYFRGTSMASPHVAGAAALVLAAPGLGSLTVAQLRHRLLACGDPIPSLSGNTVTGKRLNVARAIADCPPATYTLTLSSTPGGGASASPPGPSYTAGTVVTLTATPNAGFAFTGWTINGAPGGTANPLILTIYDHRTVVANFNAPPTNDNFPGTTVGTPPASFTAVTKGATTQPGEPTACAPIGKTIWYTFTPSVVTDLTISTVGSTFDTIIAVYTGDAVNALTPVPNACNDDIDSSTLQSRVRFTAAAGRSYRIQVGGYGGASGNVSLAFTAPAADQGLQYYPLSRPVRLLDTRAGAPACTAPGTPLTGGAARTQPARVTCDGLTIPAAARAVVGNATVVNTGAGAGAGFVTLYPSDAAQPAVSNLNYTPGQVVANAFTVGLSGGGAFNIYANTSTNFVVDVTGYYAPPGAGGLYYHPLPRPVRLLDTRAGAAACHTPGSPLAARSPLTQPARGACEGITIPADARAVVGNATAVNTGAGAVDGFVTLYPSGSAQPAVSTLNYTPGQVVPNAFTVGLGPDGAFAIYASSTTDFVADVTGYFAP